MAQKNLDSPALRLHARLGGKIRVQPRAQLTPDSLSKFYTPGVADVSRHLAEHPEEAGTYTAARRAVAVVSDGSAVLGLGNVGPQAALPVMEGKAMLFAELAGLDAWPIVLSTQDPEEIIAAVKAIAPGFGGINLEDIAAPQCFEIERRLQAELDIPVVHDDQHATAIVVLAGLINAANLAGKKLQDAQVVVNGAGAAGSAIARLVHAVGVRQLIVADSQGSLAADRKLTGEKLALAELTGERHTRLLHKAAEGADILIGVSAAGAFTADMIRSMNDRAIVFALANPTPEILPDQALQAGAMIVATGRSDFPNQINNVLIFPGLFRGLIDHRILTLNQEHKIAAAHALAALVREPTTTHIIPSVFDSSVVEVISASIASDTIG